MAGFLLLFYITLEVFVNFVDIPVWISIAISAGAGIGGGVLMLLVWKIGIFTLGFLAGSFVALCAIAFTPLSQLIAANVGSSQLVMWVTLACIIGLGVIVGVISIFVAKHFIILSSSLNGAVMVGIGVAYLAKRNLFTFLTVLFARGHAQQELDLNWQSGWPDWLILFGMVAVAVGGAFVQYRFTARNWAHDRPKGEKGDVEEEFPLIQNNELGDEAL